jgi:hypothetical protein
VTRSLAIAVAPSMSEYFHEVISDAIRVRRLEATDAASSYLVGLLCDFAHPDEGAESPFTQPLTFLLRDAMEATGAERFRRLRSLGDGILYALGFFGGHIELRGADRGYVVGVGTSAYGHAAAMLRMNATQSAWRTDVLSELAAKFERFVQVIADVAEGAMASAAAANANDARSLVKLYERWLRTGSSRLAGELTTRGILPARGKGGLH